MVAEAGTYSVTVNESCVEHVEEITVNKELPFTYSITQEPERPCIGDSVTIRVSSNAYDPRYYFRNLENGAPIPTEDGSIRVVAGEVEEVMAFLGNSCGLETRIIQVVSARPFERPQAEVSDISCASGSGRISLSVAGAAPHYEWRNDRGEIVGDSSAVLTVTTGGTYTVTLSDADHCPLTLAYSVEESPAVTASLSVTAPNCSDGGAIVITGISGTAPYRYRWYRDGSPDPLPENVDSRSNLAAGTYTVEVTDARGCSYQETVTLEGSEPLQMEATARFTDCADPSSGTIEVRPDGGVYPYSYELAGYPAQSEPVFTGLPAGAYRLRVEDARGCVSEASVVTLEELPELDLGPDHRIRPGDSVSLAPIDAPLSVEAGSFDWYPSESPVAAGGAMRVSPRFSTEYRLSYTTAQGCRVTDYVMVHVEEDPRVYVPNAFSPNGDGNNDRFEVFLGSGVQALTDLMIFDRWGELVWKKNADSEEGWDGTYRGQPLSSGVFAYVGQVRLDNGTLIPLKGSVTLIE